MVRRDHRRRSPSSRGRFLPKRSRATDAAVEARGPARQRLRHRRRAAGGQLSELTLTDALTGLGNRRQLDGMMRRLRADEADLPVGVVIVDIDHFKAVNDTHGHLVGDVVLRAVAGRLRTASPRRAGVGRWGGEEFLLVLPGLDAAATVGVAEQVRGEVRNEPIAIGAEQALEVSVSAGVATGVGAAVHDLLALADDALDEAKRGGRDRVVVRTAAALPTS